jgi:acyl-phosphate glycerol 3-phosphate acyltransferase
MPILTALLAYLIGAIPFGYLIGRWRGVDIIQHGSGNIGATNVGRILGWRFGLLVFALDFAKGAGPTAAGLSVELTLGVIAGLAAFVGHLFPIYLRFRGGKGVATGAGVVSVLLPMPTLAALASWLIVVLVSGYISLASLAAAFVLCLAYFALEPQPLGYERLILTWFCLAAAVLVFVKHRMNIARLIRGEENRIPDSGNMRLVTKTIHVLSMGLWFGMVVFFSFPVALTLFGSFEALAESTTRPTWFPMPTEYQTMPKEQGTRAAGFAVSPLFAHYFLWQGVCGLFATVTALSWSRVEPGRRVHRIRVLILMLALITVLVGWPIERHVSDLRHSRDNATDRMLREAKDTAVGAGAPSEVEDAAKAARARFTTWHLWSLLLNLFMIVLVTIAMALAAQLPGVAVANERPGLSLPPPPG